MKMVKRLLLGSAAGLAVVGGVQAAELPVKARPAAVEYVKICTLYGEGFYYIPGSDTCIKIGGYVRADYGWNVAGARTPAYSGTQGAQDRTVSQYSTRHRANLQVDTRTQTQYGTLRTFQSLHFQNEDGVFSFNVARAFIQWAGFTFGHAQSFQDTWAINDSWHYMQQQNNSDTGANGVNQIAYTWELGNGMTLTVGADEVRRKRLTDLTNAGALRVGAEPTDSFIGQRWPDPHIDFKINQAWGYWATTFVLHDVSATYFNTNTAGVFPCPGPASSTAATTPLTICDHPDDKVGWAIQTGAELKLDFINPGDRVGFGIRYAQGASGFGGGSNLSSGALFGSGNQVAVGWITDGLFLNGTEIELTTTWTAQAAYEHYWTPTFKTSFYGGYTQILYNDRAKGFFVTNVCGTTAATSQTNFNSIPAGATLAAHCDPDWAFFSGGARTQWTPSPGFFMGVDVFYTRVFTAFRGAIANVQPTPIIGARPGGLYRIDDQGNVGAVFRAQRNFNAGD